MPVSSAETHNQSLEFAPALAGPPPDGFSAPLQTRRSARRYAYG